MDKLLCFVFIILLMVSCSKESPSAETVPAQDNKAPAAELGTDRIGELEKSIIESRNKPETKENRRLSADNYGSRRFLMTGTGEGIYPKDFIIGNLTPEDEAGTPENAVRSFFRCYEAGNLRKQAEALFTQENRVVLTMLFEEWRKNGYIPEEIRIGQSRENGGKALVAVRGFGKKGSCICEFTLEKVDDSWKISSFSGNLEELETEKEKTEELFEPEVYYFF